MKKVKIIFASLFSVSLLVGILVNIPHSNDAKEVKASDPANTIYVGDWSTLKSKVKSANDNDYIALTSNINTDELDNRVVADKKNITIDLKGHSIKKSSGSSSYYKNGHIFEIQGDSNFRLIDSVGGGSLEYGCGNKGGAINIHDGSTLTVNNVIFANNRADIDGGAIYNRGHLIMNDCIVKYNTANESGAGIYNTGDAWFELTNVEIAYNIANDDGGGMKISMDNDCTMRNCNIHHNKSKTDDGGGFVVDDDSHKLRIYNTSVSYNTAQDDGGGMEIKDGDVEVYGCDFSYNEADFGGGIYADDNFVIKDEGYGMTAICQNTAKSDGGGLYTKADCSLDNCEISYNTCSWLGGGICVAEDECIFNSGSINFNVCTNQYGGGVAVKAGAIFYLYGGTVSENNALLYGGGIYLDPDYSSNNKLHLKGSPIIRNNTASRGPDLWFASSEELQLDGKLLDGAHISFTMVEGHTVHYPSYTYWYDVDDFDELTKDYSVYNGSEDPSNFFYSSADYEVYYDEDEQEVSVRDVKIVVPPPDPVNKNTFIPWNEQIEVDSNKLTGKNWLSGVSGERKINEINTPVTHDSSMKDVASATSCIGSLLNYYDYAITQYDYIYQQLNDGVRGLDLRINNKRVWKKDRSRGDQSDDGENLFMCHGKNSAGGTYFAKDPDSGYPLNLQKVIDWVEEFLTNNPTEYVMMDFSAETQHDYDVPIIYARLEKILRERVQDVNPTTGEPFFYLEDGVFGKNYSDWPKLKDVRGKMVIKCTDKDHEVNIGGIKNVSFYGRLYNPEQEGSYKQGPNERLRCIEKFADEEIGQRNLPTDASRIIDQETGKEVYFVTCTNCIKDEGFGIPGEKPLVLSRFIHFHTYGWNKIFGPHQAGKYVGFVSSDAVTSTTCAYVYTSNFFDGLEYKTITVNSGKASIPTQTFKLLKGSEITIPGYIYNDYEESDTNGHFNGWSIGSSRIASGSKYIVNDDVTFNANWLESGNATEITVRWFDADNKDGLRPTSFNIKTNGGLDTYTVDEEHGWFVSVPYLTGSDITTDWELAKDNIDGEGTYRFLKMPIPSSPSRQMYFLLLIHTPSDVLNISSTISFTDNCLTNEDGPRPDYVTFGLYQGSTLIESKEVAVGDGAYYSSATISFASVPKYRNGDLLHYDVRFISSRHDEDKGDLSLYDCSINGYDVAYTLKNLVNTNLKVYWLDIDALDRPSSLTVGLKDSNTGKITNDTLNPQSSDDSFTLYSYQLIADGISEETGELYIDFSHYQVVIDNQPDEINFYTFSNEDGLYVVASVNEYSSDVEMVESLIDAIGEVTLEKEKSILLARSFYDNLSNSSKASVTNYEALTNAEETLGHLKQAGIETVENLIEDIGVVEYTEESLSKIELARSAYDFLSSEQKLQVGNYATLVKAEETYAYLEEKAQKELEEVNDVIAAINEIGEVIYGGDDDSFSDIDEARHSYDLLTSEQKAKVTNYSVLVNAEAEYFALYFLSETGSICSTGSEGDDHSLALSKIWDDLNLAWNKLNDDAKEVLVSGTASANISDFVARYTHIMRRYSDTLTPFAGGPAFTALSNQLFLSSIIDLDSPIVLIIGVSTLVVVAVLFVFVSHRRKDKNQSI